MKIALLSLAVSLALTVSPALAGWGTNGQYGNAPTGGGSGTSTSTSTNTGGGYGGTGSMDGGSSGGEWNGGESTGGGYGGGNSGGVVWNNGGMSGGGNGPVWNNGGGGYPKGGSSKKVYCLAADQIANMVQQRGYLMYSINYSNGRFVVNVADQRNYPYILKFNCQGKLTSSTPVKMKTGKKPYGGNGGNQGYGGGNQNWGGNGGGQDWGGGNQGYGGNGGGIQVWGGNGGGYGGNGPSW